MSRAEFWPVGLAPFGCASHPLLAVQGVMRAPKERGFT